VSECVKMEAAISGATTFPEAILVKNWPAGRIRYFGFGFMSGLSIVLSAYCRWRRFLGGAQGACHPLRFVVRAYAVRPHPRTNLLKIHLLNELLGKPFEGRQLDILDPLDDLLRLIAFMA
jgi:hypothetical protein